MLWVRSILVILTPEGDCARVLERAVMLARRCNARLDLFACEAESAYVLQHLYDANEADYQRRLGQAGRRVGAWLEQQWTATQVSDVAVTMEAVCETPLYEAVRCKVEHCAPDLVVHGLGTGRAGIATAADLDLVRTCPVPLLLMRRKIWSTTPSVVAAVDISGDESPQLMRRILQVAASISASCGASLDVLYAGRFEDSGSSAVGAARALLAAGVAQADVQPRELCVVRGDPATAIPGVVRGRAYDLLVLGALTHRETLTALVGSLTGRLIETVDADLLLVRPAPPAKSAALSAA
jgi:nucleotide-binding universal stress UspA family protein